MSADESREPQRQAMRRPRGRVAGAKSAPPVVPARVAVLKANYRQAWLMFLFAVSLIIAWGVPLHYFLMRRIAARVGDCGIRDQHTFVAVAYEGISDSPREVSPERFRQQLTALEQAGYNPITLEDIHQLYAEGKPLPRKAILLTFDHSRKSSYFEVRSLLSRVGWPAVMFVWTLPIEDEDPAALRWPYIRTMLRSGLWEAGAQSHRGFERIVADSAGNRHNFMTSPRWLPEEMRYEDPQSFRERLRADHQFTRDLIARAAGTPPRAFAFPYGDYGQHDERAVLSRRINMELISEFYDLGFIHGFAALNTRYTDPRRLNRLLVQPDWSAAELLDRLENAWPRPTGFAASEARENPHLWLRDWGHFEQGHALVHLRAPSETTGAKTWINGSDLFDDFRVGARFRLTAGQVGFHLRATPDGERHIYLGLDHNGNAWLRQKHPSLPAFTLGSEMGRLPSNGKLELEIHIRGNNFFARLNDRPLFSEVVTLRGPTRPGMLGLSIWDPSPGVAAMTISALEAEPFVNRVITWQPIAARDQRLAGWLHRHAVEHTHFAPPWLRIATRAQGERLGWDPGLYRDLAHTYDLRFTPEIILEGLAAQEDGLPQQLAQLAAELNADGLFCNLTELRGEPSLTRITAWLMALSTSLAEQQMDLLVQLPAAWERETTLAALLQNLPNLQIVFSAQVYGTITGQLPARRQRLARLTRVDLHELPIPEIHTLTGGDAVIEDWTQVHRHQLLRTQGHEAFAAGAFDRALTIWGRWSDLEPHNPVPLRLMGDVHRRRNNYSEAIESFRASLERDPGQIELAAETARMLHEQANRPDEASELLDLYVRLFPGNSIILLTQAEMLIREGRRVEAGQLIQRVVQLDPEDLEARAMLHSLLRRPRSRFQNMQQMLMIGQRPGMHDHFADIIRRNELLLRPEAWTLFPFIESAARAERDDARDPRSAYFDLLPRDTMIIEGFRDGPLSGEWEPYGDRVDEEELALLLAAQPAAAEAVLRLARSDTIHSGILEAEIGEARGTLWLYARRSQSDMIRFGFTPEERLYLQVWEGDRLLVNQVRAWQRPASDVRLRLEVRGDGAMGFVNDRPAFGAPIALPASQDLGWWGLSPWAPQFGVAEAVVRRVGGGPLPVQIAAFKGREDRWQDDALVERLTPFAPRLQAVVPTWYAHELDGMITPNTRDRYASLRLLTRFHRIRLLPAIRNAIPRTLNFDELIALAQADEIDGFTLLFVRMPGEEWFARAEEALLDSNLSLLVVRIDPDQEWAEMREVGPRRGLFPGSRRIRQVSIDADPAPPTDPHASPLPSGQGEFEPPPHRLLLF